MSNLYRRTGLDRQGLLLAILAVVAGAIAVIGLTAVTPMAVDAHSSGHSCTSSNHCTPSVGLVYSYGDRWDNYDSNSQSLHNNNVDWAVDPVFYDNAEVDKVKNLINQYNGVGHSGGTKHIIVREANEYQNGSSISYVQMWDDDSGKKNVAPNCSTYTSAYHYRVYADESAYSHDRFYNDTWGFYVIATAHWDENDGCSGARHGWGENAEATVRAWSDNVPGWGITANYWNMSNNRCCFFDKNNTHYWQNTGAASVIEVP